jgi:hypothetical protein
MKRLAALMPLRRQAPNAQDSLTISIRFEWISPVSPVLLHAQISALVDNMSYRAGL